jgi:hypothetical protein
LPAGLWDCLKIAAASIAAGAACGAAIVELGANLVADAACVLAVDKANTFACTLDCGDTEGFGCDAE